MSSITTRAAKAFRNDEIAGEPNSGPHKPIKADIRALFAVIDAAVSAIGSAGGATVFKSTVALLNADLAHTADTVALVYADPTAANNDFYVKVGGSGSGGWNQLGLIIAPSLAGSIADLIAAIPDIEADRVAAEAAATDAQANNASAQGAAATAVTAADDAQAAASAAGPVAIYDTKAAANAAVGSIADLAVVEVMVDEGMGGFRTRYRKESGALVYKITLWNYLRPNPSADPTRSMADIVAPFTNGNGVYDNVLGLINQNISADGTKRFNAAVALKDSNGVERGAVGYSRNSALAPNDGYHADTVYVEFGNPFEGNDQNSDYRLIGTIAAGSPYWGGAAKQWFAMEVLSSDGTINMDTQGGNWTTYLYGGAATFRNGALRVGALGGDVQPVEVAMTSAWFRVREKVNANTVTLTNNLKTDNSLDLTTQAGWQIDFGGSGVYDRFKISRASAGAGVRTLVDLFNIRSSGVMSVPGIVAAAYANDSAAAAAGIQIGEFYHNAGAVRVRIA